jgi:hypothetical protein
VARVDRSRRVQLATHRVHSHLSWEERVLMMGPIDLNSTHG